MLEKEQARIQSMQPELFNDALTMMAQAIWFWRQEELVTCEYLRVANDAARGNLTPEPEKALKNPVRARGAAFWCAGLRG